MKRRILLKDQRESSTEFVLNPSEVADGLEIRRHNVLLYGMLPQKKQSLSKC
jgi:hypothetical protein